eukprot:12151750-Alexandrium_andersonii.AAC.1
MSASLVGSEMCIRDRRLRVPVLICADWNMDPQQLQATNWPASMGLEAVSYTHLTLPTICSV